jgi:hypothetical protein
MDSDDWVGIARANARDFVDTIHEKYAVTLALDREAVTWVDGFIAGRRSDLAPETRAGLIDLVGAFIGECIIQCWSGEWLKRGDSLLVRLEADREVSPFAIVTMCFDHRNSYKTSVLFNAVPDLARVRTGGLYAARDDRGRHLLYKVLAADHLGVHLRRYRGGFGKLPERVDAAQLDSAIGDDLDEMGIGHLPLAHEGFWELQPQLVQIEPVLDDELEGYRIWLGEKCG